MSSTNNPSSESTPTSHDLAHKVIDYLGACIEPLRGEVDGYEAYVEHAIHLRLDAGASAREREWANQQLYDIRNDLEIETPGDRQATAAMLRWMNQVCRMIWSSPSEYLKLWVQEELSEITEKIIEVLRGCKLLEVWKGQGRGRSVDRCPKEWQL